MPGRERKQKNDPGKYTADIWGNQLEQKRQPPGGKRRGKKGSVIIDGEVHTQSTLFSGEEMRVPFPDAPVNKVPDRLGMTAEPGTLFSRPLTELSSTQPALFVTPADTANDMPHLPAGDNQEDCQHAPISTPPAPEAEGQLIRELVTIVKLWQLTNRQRAELVIPTALCILASKDKEKRVQYRAGIITKRSVETARQQEIDYVGERTHDVEQAYQQLETGVQERGITWQALQPIVVPAKPEPVPELLPTASELEQNPLLAILKEDEIYVDPFEVTIEEAEEAGFPLLRRDVVTYRWWLEFPFDTREQPELYQALIDAKWKWGGYRQQWNTNAHFPQMPQNMYYANAGGAYYSEENADRIEARATKARQESTAHLERSDQLASIIPFGQPMLTDHYSYRSDVSYRKKIWRQMDLFVEFYKKAEWLENRAEGSRRLQRSKSSIPAMQNRLERLQADLRSYRRGYEEAKAKGAEKEYDYYKRRMTILASEMLPVQAGIAQRGGLPIEKAELERPLQPGDLIQIRGHAMYVVKANPKTLRVADPRVHDATGKMWELTYKRSDFQKLLATKEEVAEARRKAEENKGEA